MCKTTLTNSKPSFALASKSSPDSYLSLCYHKTITIFQSLLSSFQGLDASALIDSRAPPEDTNKMKFEVHALNTRRGSAASKAVDYSTILGEIFIASMTPFKIFFSTP